MNLSLVPCRAPRRGSKVWLAIACGVFLYASAMAIEKPSYEIVKADGDFELRRYEGYIVAETLVEGAFDEAGNRGFRILADYIFGNNKRRESVAMTAPVSQKSSEKIAMTAPVTMDRQATSWRVAFMMPSEYTLETLPEPLDSRVELKAIAGGTFAAHRYSGTWSQSRYQEHEARLRDWVEDSGWTAVGEPIFARYDPPFKPWFLRRNEILVEVEDDLE